MNEHGVLILSVQVSRLCVYYLALWLINFSAHHKCQLLLTTLVD